MDSSSQTAPKPKRKYTRPTGRTKAFKDQTGKRFGRLTVLRESEKLASGHTMWECLCDCGNMRVINSAHLTPRKPQQSCGCVSAEQLSRRSKKEKCVRGQNMLWGRYLRGARDRGLGWSITKPEFIEITSRDCFYCGVPPVMVIGQIETSDHSYHGVYLYNGIDRVDNARGYSKDNIVPCCGRCNMAKHAETQPDFREWIRKVYLHWASTSA
jgi:hypothetical protein